MPINPINPNKNMQKYQVVYHGNKAVPNHIVSVPCSFAEAFRLVHELQWETVCGDSGEDKKTDLYIVEPIFKGANYEFSSIKK
jgi:hypothetical protein